MAKNNRSGILAIVREMLSDEHVAGTDQTWKDDELGKLISGCLIEISERSPYHVIEEVHTVAGSKDLDISAIEDLLWVEYIEYPTGEDPKEFHNCKVFGTTLTMEIDSAPSAADEDVHVYCAKVHQLTDVPLTGNTLNPSLERLLALGVAGQAAINRAQYLINRVNNGGSSVPSQLQAWGTTQIQLYRAGLQKATGNRVSQSYPR
jgi:hypothetical protein